MLTRHSGIASWRGIAVILVMLHHFQVPLFSGGLIGVDIFFVISGFIITAILLESSLDISNIKKFYYRRVIRIYPSLILSLLLAIVLAMFTQPTQVEKYLKDSALVLSNIYNINLITNFTELTAIQHLWSISVEMQFYFIFPIILGITLTIFRGSKKALTIVASALTVSSFIYYNYMLTQNPSISYYSLESRFWEMGLGILVAINLAKIKTYLGEVNLWTGKIIPAILLVAYLLSYNGGISPFQYLPIMGVILVLLYDDKKSQKKKSFFGKVGEISYQLYLFHWILWFFLEPIAGRILALFLTIIISVPLAYIANYKIDAPLRKKGKL
jgi:peptidoglycan/LPS O-acetylase OafA/YrhL